VLTLFSMSQSHEPQHGSISFELNWLLPCSSQENEAAEQPASPAEKSFVDDDGTAYEWDPKARRFVEIGAGGDAGGPQYDVSDMTFAGEAEVIPPMPELPVSGVSAFTPEFGALAGLLRRCHNLRAGLHAVQGVQSQAHL